MPTRDSTTTGTPCWIDLFTSDPDASRAFYGDLFGWTSDVAGEEYGGYINFLREGAPIAGGMKNDGSTGNPDGGTSTSPPTTSRRSPPQRSTTVGRSTCRRWRSATSERWR